MFVNKNTLLGVIYRSWRLLLYIKRNTDSTNKIRFLLIHHDLPTAICPKYEENYITSAQDTKSAQIGLKKRKKRLRVLEMGNSAAKSKKCSKSAKLRTQDKLSNIKKKN